MVHVGIQDVRCAMAMKHLLDIALVGTVSLFVRHNSGMHSKLLSPARSIPASTTRKAGELYNAYRSSHSQNSGFTPNSPYSPMLLEANTAAYSPNAVRR